MAKLRKPAQENSIETIKDHTSIIVLKENNSIVKLKNTEIAFVTCKKINGMLESTQESHIAFCDLSSTNRLLEHVLDDLRDTTAKLNSIVLVIPKALSSAMIESTKTTFSESYLGKAYKKLPKTIITAEHNYFRVTNQGSVETNIDLQALKTELHQGQEAQKPAAPRF